VLVFEVNTKRIPQGDPVRRALEEALAGAASAIAEGRDRVHDLRSPLGVSPRISRESVGAPPRRNHRGERA